MWPQWNCSSLISQPILFLWLTDKRKDKALTEQKAKERFSEFAMNEELSNSSSSPLNFRCLPSYNIQDILYPSPSVSDPSFDAECALECSHPHPHPHYPSQLGSASVHNNPRDGDHSIISSSANLGINSFIYFLRFDQFNPKWLPFFLLLLKNVREFMQHHLFLFQLALRNRGVRRSEITISCNRKLNVTITYKNNGECNKRNNSGN